MKKLLLGLKPYKIGVAIVLLLTLFRVLAELFLPTIMADIVDNGIVKDNRPLMLQLGGLMIAVAAFGTVCACFSSYYSSKVGSSFAKDLRRKMFYKVESFGIEEANQVGISSLINRTTNDVSQVQQVTMMILRMVVLAPMMCIGGIVMAISKNAKLSLIFLVAIPVLALTIYLVIKKGIPLFKVMQNKLDNLNGVLRENLTGVRVIRSFNKEEFEQKRFRHANEDLTTTALKVNKIMAITMPIMMIVLNLSTVAIIWFGSIQVDQGNMQVGDIMAFVQYGMQIMFSLMMVSMIFVMMPRASASAERINEVLEISPVMKDNETNSQMLRRGDVEFRNVSFSYPLAEKPVLEHLSFQMRPGTTTAIIGGTGSGKSTILHLIARFYDVNKGEILVDGMNIKEYAQGDLRQLIGYVPQKAVLFTGTIADNIRFGKEDATEAEIRKALEISQSKEFVDELEKGIYSELSQGGANLSGGQKQRLSIARALVRKPRIYLFDDSFSALDYRTDANLRKALNKEITDANVVIVAQRVSTIKDADTIIVLDEGKIAGIGTHEQLLASCSVYQEIVKSQGVVEETV
ncbi:MULTISPECIES: ABC transporter ATP-binding protein [unclassified Niallia]|uniref:ABC transporter ATP-binding protein n=1 Tax=unclassified Niallia TaxID=2837522 RepID=UPI001ED9DEEC|nr:MULTISPECIES: ABC transporter ATP-binding protein [unclassified Niallia]MCM3029504.1 ABC transporter ATP-binding protein/permease [Niallia sp. MER 6]MDL0435190.1 ABC transporter ATP-binding protein [Niallia sp. SS-2023]UPO87044.1 ABC transporter ATP-binding protein/permease [Niallia sp. Man26]